MYSFKHNVPLERIVTPLVVTGEAGCDIPWSLVGGIVPPLIASWVDVVESAGIELQDPVRGIVHHHLAAAPEAEAVLFGVQPLPRCTLPVL